MRAFVNFVIIISFGAAFGLLCSAMLPPPFSVIVGMIGGFAIGWYGEKYLTNSRDQLS
jgi:hypothetical protein